ncbi:MAG TPA: mandelate racemase/muconate lactonizing enzyme family protein [Solirubrobacterales bacterium]|nr:mandelate racemase/muconate lactonizing enzyme family protein [Solirubrobacterales bacterium]
MKFSSVEVIPYALPFREPYVTARGRLARREMVLLRIRDEDGFEGLGEAVPLSLRGGVTIETVVRELESVELPNHDGLSLPARCAVTTALLDHEKKRGATTSERHAVRCNATLVTGAPRDVATEAERWAADGFGTFKLKVGAGEDVAQVRAVRAALGDEAKIRLDANASWSLEEATEILGAVEPLGIELVEQPVETIEEAAELARRVSIPLAGDESIVTIEDAARAVAARAFSVTGVKISKVGGIGPGLRINSVLPAYVASALDGPVGIAAGRRLAQEVDATHAPERRLAHGLATQRLFASTIAAAECRLEGDLLHAAPGPGLGVVIDEDSLRHHRL